MTSTATLPARIPASGAVLIGDLSVPADARALIVFAHGSGSGRHSSRNRAVAEALQHDRFATLLMDLLTEAEELVDVVTAEFRFDIPLLADRVAAAIEWAEAQAQPASLPIGLFGASTGAAAALIAAAELPDTTGAVVSRGGRPDLADGALPKVTAPTLLIVGERDEVVIDLNRQALALLGGLKRLDTVPGATHLFEERGALEQVSDLAVGWFAQYLG